MSFGLFREGLVKALAAGQPLRRRTTLLLGLLVFITSFSVKSLHALDLAPYTHTTALPYVGLTDDYDRRAALIVGGDGILIPRIKNPADTGLLSHAPGYSIYLSAIYASFGRSFFTVQALQNAFNSVSPVIMFLLGGLLLSWRVGFVAGLLAAVSHHLGYYSNLILPDALCALPIVMAVYLLSKSRGEQGGGWATYALAGFALGLSVWLRPNGMLLSLFLGLLLLIVSPKRRPLFPKVVLLAAASWAVIAPITIRNYLIYHELVLVQVGTGLNLWEGIGESDDRFGAVAKDEEVALQEAEIYNNPDYAGWWASPDGIQRDRDRVRKSLRIIASHPFWYARVMLARMSDMAKYSAFAPLVARHGAPPESPGQAVDSEGVNRGALTIGRSLSFLRPVARAAQRLAKETALVFVLAGMLTLFWVDWRKAAFLMTVPLYYFLIQSFMHTEFRYVLPMHYFLFVFAAIMWVLISSAVAGLWRRARRATTSNAGPAAKGEA